MSSRPVTCSASTISWLKPPLPNLADAAYGPPIAACLQNMPYVFTRELVGLPFGRQFDCLQSAARPQLSSDLSRGMAAGGIAIQHEDHAPESFQQ